MGDLDAETSKNVCDSFGKNFGVGEDDKTTMVGIIMKLGIPYERFIKNTLETIAESSFIFFITHLLPILAGRRLTFAFKSFAEEGSSSGRNVR